MSDFDLNELMETFVTESLEDVAALEAGLLALENAPGDLELRRELQRHAHTLKGNASCVGLNAITEFAHVYEELLERVTSGEATIDAALVDVLLNGLDTFRRLIDERDACALTDGDRVLIARIRGEEAPLPLAPEDARQARKVTGAAARSVRVSSAKLNRMLDLTGEIAIARGRVREVLSRDASDDLIEIERQVDLLHSELQELIMRARMVPVGPLFHQYARTVRDLAATLGKNARLITIGDDVEVDTAAVELLRDPLTHMIRNAIDHGIETSQVRAAKGKSPVGHITLEARHDAGSIVIRVSDDGAGLDTKAILERAGADATNDADVNVFDMIFRPGFSTAGQVTDISGRGVGMDVVRGAIESLRGTIAIDSREGEGTTFTIRLPLTLAVIEGFGVTAGDETYVVPMDHVVECLELPLSASGDEATGVLLLRDEVVPFVRLRHHFGRGGTSRGRENVLVVQHEGARAGLAVDHLHGASQAVIKPLGEYFRDVPGIAGSSILGNGRVALILDTPAILRSLADASMEHS